MAVITMTARTPTAIQRNPSIISSLPYRCRFTLARTALAEKCPDVLKQDFSFAILSALARYPSGKGEVCKTFIRGFDSHPRLQFSCFIFIELVRPFSLVYLICTEFLLIQDRVGFPRPHNVGFKLLLARSHPRVVMSLRDAHTLMTEENGDALDRHARK